MHYFENVITPINQKSYYLFVSERKNYHIWGKMEHIKKGDLISFYHISIAIRNKEVETWLLLRLAYTLEIGDT